MGVIVHERFNRKVVNPIPAKFAKAMLGETVYLINLTDQSYVFHRSYGCYMIPGVKPGQDFTAIPIHGRLEHIDQGDEKYIQQITEASDIAEDLARQANDGILVPEGTASYMGVFVSDSQDPEAHVLAEMQARLAEFWSGQVELADQYWDDPRDHKNISSLMRRAAKNTKQTRPWTYEVKNMASCPACSSSIPQGMAICKECGALLDEKKARKFFPQYFTAEAEAATPRPRAPKKPTTQP